MAKKRKKTSSFRSRMTKLFTYLVTIVGGAGISGWAKPDLPFVGAGVQKAMSAVKAQLGSSSTAGLLGPGAEQSAQSYGMPVSAPGASASAGGANHASYATPASGAAAASAHTVSNRPAQGGTATGTVSIASYNIQVFGESKMNKKDVMNYLVQIVRRFDLVAIQEVRAKSDRIIPDFVKMINADGSQYSYVVGPRLGRSNSKEQYAFIFRSDKFEVDARSVLTIDDPADALHREPLIARFRVRTPDPSQGFSFWLVNTHTDPDEVPEEVDALANVFSSVQQQGWGEDDVILLGDLNASEKQFGRLGTLPGMRYAIAGVPTNTRGKKTYDNILFDGRATVEYTGRSGVGNVMEHFGVSMDQALKISDHFPVWAIFGAYEGRGAAQAAASQPSGIRPR